MKNACCACTFLFPKSKNPFSHEFLKRIFQGVFRFEHKKNFVVKRLGCGRGCGTQSVVVYLLSSFVLPSFVVLGKYDIEFLFLFLRWETKSTLTLILERERRKAYSNFFTYNIAKRTLRTAWRKFCSVKKARRKMNGVENGIKLCQTRLKVLFGAKGLISVGSKNKRAQGYFWKHVRVTEWVMR